MNSFDYKFDGTGWGGGFIQPFQLGWTDTKHMVLSGGIGIPKVGLLSYIKAGDGLTDTIGLSVDDYRSVDESVRDIFFIDASTVRPVTDAHALAMESPLLNLGTMCGSYDRGVALYHKDASDVVLTKVRKYFSVSINDVFAIDSFVAANGTPLTSHTSNYGDAWSLSFGSGVATIDNGRVWASMGSGGVYALNITPPSADYEISADLNAVTVSSSNQMGVMVRSTSGSFTGYLVVFTRADSTLRLYRAGSGALHGSVGVTLSEGGSARLTLGASGNDVYVRWNDKEVIRKTMSGEDIISSAGRPALYFQGVASSNIGDHHSNVVVRTIPNYANPRVLVESDFSDNLYDNVENPRQSSFARFVFRTNSDTLRFTGTTNIRAVFPSYASLGVISESGEYPKFTFTADGTNDFALRLPGAGYRHVEIVSGLQTKPASYVLGTFVDSVQVETGKDLFVITPNTTGRVMIYGDSISVGGNSDDPEYEGYPVLLRTDYDRSVLIEAYGFRSLYNDAATTELVTDFVQKVVDANPSKLWLAIGTNDYGLNKWSATTFGAAYAALLDAVHSAVPDLPIICQTPILRDSETANGSGSTLGDYRSQISSAVSSRSSYCTLIDGAGILTTADLDDGVHPTIAGHAKYAAYVDSQL